MRYLKKYEGVQSKEDYIEEVRNFFEDGLVDMLDMGYRVEISDIYNQFQLTIIVSISNNTKYWKDIKDFFIPFFEILCENYKIRKQLGLNKDGDIIIGAFYRDVDDVLLDKIDDDSIATRVKVSFSKK